MKDIHFMVNDFLLKNEQELASIMKIVTAKPLAHDITQKAQFLKEFTRGLYLAHHHLSSRQQIDDDERLGLERKRVQLLEELKHLRETTKVLQLHDISLPKKSIIATIEREIPPPPDPFGSHISQPPFGPLMSPSPDTSAIDTLLQRHDVREIICDGSDTPLRIRTELGTEETNVLLSYEEINRLMQRFAQESHSAISEDQPFMNTILPSGAQIQGTLGTPVITPRFIITKDG